MPPPDPETLTRSADDSQIASETRFNNDALSDPPESPPDYPAESFYLAKEDELDWFDRNAFYERKDSTKGNSISTSQRFSVNLKSKPSIIGFPKPQKTSYVDSKHRRNCKPINTRFFPKRSRSSGKSNIPLSEPGSPKVSCIGRVRSKKERSRRNKLSHRSNRVVVEPEKKTGLWKTLKAKLGLGRRKTQAVDVDTPTMREESREKQSLGMKKGMGSESVVEAPGLGGLKRFSSGRKTESWGGCDVDLEISESDSSDHGSVWRRRGVGPPKEVDCVREWKLVGPASV